MLVGLGALGFGLALRLALTVGVGLLGADVLGLGVTLGAGLGAGVIEGLVGLDVVALVTVRWLNAWFVVSMTTRAAVSRVIGGMATTIGGI